MLQAISIMGALGLVIGICLAVASKVFYVYVDPLILAVDDVLPGANCGGCGYPGCSSNAEAIVAGKSAPNSCVAAGAETAEAIAAILGVSIEAKEPDIARPGCTYGVADADVKYLYDGLSDCRAAALLSGGMKVCTVGCLGLGTCANACPFDAITMGPEGLPVVDEERCTGCGTCERVCPKHIINLSSVTRRIIREYTTEECTTPCQRACPAGIDICEYIRLIKEGDTDGAIRVIKERNPFPTVIGRICPRPCENDCRRNLVDEPVAINFLKRYAADIEMESGQHVLPYKAPDTGRKIAVIGGGVEGLSAAFFSARLGHQTVVYEASEKPGGLLRSAIADYRLPMEVLDWDIAGISAMGVELQAGKALGKDVTIAGLLADGSNAVFLAAGGWDSRLARGGISSPEKPIPGTFLLLDLLKYAGPAKLIESGKGVVIAGGGKLAVDAAEKCKAAGAETVTVIFRDVQGETAIDQEAIQQLEEMGAAVHFGSAVSGVTGEGEQLTGVAIINTETKEKIDVAAGNLIFASGRMPEMIFSRIPIEGESEDAESTEPILWQGNAPYKKPAAKGENGLFSSNDELTDYSGAIRAIAAGRRAAASIHMALYDMPVDLPDNVVTPDSYVQNVYSLENVAAVPRQIMPMAPGKNLTLYGELEKGFGEAAAKEEASRCLRCGLICYERSIADEVPKEKEPVEA